MSRTRHFSTTRQAAVLAVALLSTTACGSTVQSRGGTAAGLADAPGSAAVPQADGLGAAGAGTSTSGGGLGAPGAPGEVSAPGGAGATSGGIGRTSTGGTSGVGSGGTSGGASVTQVGPGVTATSIALGLGYSVNNQAAAAALGASGAGVGGGNGKRQWEILLKDLNARGGILGRKLLPVYHVEDASESKSTDEREQVACSDWTQDNKVFAAVASEASPSETLQNCLNKAGVIQLWEDLTRSDARTFARYPYYLETGTLRMDRVAAYWPRALAAQKYFTGWDTATGKPGAMPVKVGIVSFDDSTTVRAVEQQLKPQLKAVGYPAADWVRIQYPSGAADNGTAISAIQAAELRFASEGITHVLPFDAQGAGIGAFFAQGADSQRYYPRYGLHSGVGAQTLVDAGVWPKTQLNGAVGYGWVPLLDVRLAYNPDNGPMSNAARRYCVELMAKGGEDVSSAIVKRQVITKCDTLRFLKQALEQAGSGLTREAFALGANRLGTSFQSGMTFGTRFDPQHHDGAVFARNFGYIASCECFQYAGGTARIP